MALHDKVAALRAERLKHGGDAVPARLHGVDKARIVQVLARIDLGTNADLVDGVFALLDDQTESWFARPPTGARFCDGATTAHLAAFIHGMAGIRLAGVA